ncbi:MAG TPA: hypothetical protein VD736_09820 [Nitrososphaera sp.]|nr:hypothetical protein [Nitrososphaera sp.]
MPVIIGDVHKDSKTYACVEENGCLALMDPVETILAINVEKIGFTKQQHCDMMLIHSINGMEDSIDVFFIELKNIKDKNETLAQRLQNKAVGSLTVYNEQFANIKFLEGKDVRKYFVFVIPADTMATIRSMVKHLVGTSTILEEK